MHTIKKFSAFSNNELLFGEKHRMTFRICLEIASFHLESSVTGDHKKKEKGVGEQRNSKRRRASSIKNKSQESYTNFSPVADKDGVLLCTRVAVTIQTGGTFSQPPLGTFP